VNAAVAGAGSAGAAAAPGAGRTTRRVPTYCYQCVAGPDLLTVKVEDGVATEVEPNFCAAAVHPGGGKVCVKAFGLVQKTYNPNRVLTPMKRTNPKKGRDQDPGLRADRLGRGAVDHRRQAERHVREQGLLTSRATRAWPPASAAAARRSPTWAPFPAFLAAWGPVDMGFGSGQGVKCYHSEHLYGEFWHRAFIVAARHAALRTT
jgi:phenylacetyl-CoA:acceptor oxidoreductase